MLRQEVEQTFTFSLGSPGPVEMRPSNVWRFLTVDGHWRVTVTTTFLALETDRYGSRSDFFGRFGALLAALQEHLKLTTFERLGLRYINRVVGEPLGRLTEMIHPALVGMLGTPAGLHADLAVSEHLFGLPEENGMMRTRWGLIPANLTVDPNAIEPLAEPSWVLDLDAFREEVRLFDAAQVAAEATALAERAYSFFRWSVTDEFLKHFGGRP